MLNILPIILSIIQSVTPTVYDAPPMPAEYKIWGDDPLEPPNRLDITIVYSKRYPRSVEYKRWWTMKSWKQSANNQKDIELLGRLDEELNFIKEKANISILEEDEWGLNSSYFPIIQIGKRNKFQHIPRNVTNYRPWIQEYIKYQIDLHWYDYKVYMARVEFNSYPYEQWWRDIHYCRGFLLSNGVKGYDLRNYVEEFDCEAMDNNEFGYEYYFKNHKNEYMYNYSHELIKLDFEDFEPLPWRSSMSERIIEKPKLSFELKD